jgi:glycosyltransferase involved in cell wall biosynthesis
MHKKIKTAYIEGRPKGHPTHSAYAASVNAVFHHVDFRLRYHDIPEASALKRYSSWLLCALTFPKRKSYDVFLSEEAYFMLGLMKTLGLISKKQKLIGIMGSHTLYFLHTKQYSELTTKMFIRLFRMYDAFICEGPIQYQLLKNFLGEDHNVKVYQIFNGSPASRFNKLIGLRPNLGKLNILTIGAIPNQNRIHYKGIDLMLAAFNVVKVHFPDLTFTIVGEYDRSLTDKLLNELCPAYKNDVIFTGQSNDLSEQLKDACLYLHTARGEAWGISVTEAMAAGVTPIVSDWTGSKEAVMKVSDELVVPLEVSSISEKINWYLNLALTKKQELSEKCKAVSQYYIEENAINNFKLTFEKAFQESQK